MSISPFFTTVYPRIELGGKTLELIATVKFTWQPYWPGRGPSYSDGGLPPEGDCPESIDVVELQVAEGGKFFVRLLPVWLADWIAENLDEQILRDALPPERDPDDAREDDFDRKMRED